MSALFNIIPWYYRALALALIFAAFGTICWMKGLPCAWVTKPILIGSSATAGAAAPATSAPNATAMAVWNFLDFNTSFLPGVQSFLPSYPCRR